jgi:hypothetical protein
VSLIVKAVWSEILRQGNAICSKRSAADVINVVDAKKDNYWP